MNNNLDLSKALENKEYCIALVKGQFQYVGDITKECTGYWLMSDGTLIDCKAHGNIDLFLIRQGFIEIDKYLEGIVSLEENNTVFEIVCKLCSACEKRAFIDAIQIGAQLMLELQGN